MENVDDQSANEDNWRVNVDDDGVACLTLDCPGQSTNSLSAKVLEELGDHVKEFTRQRPAALVFSSAKSSGFIAGADIREFEQLTDPLVTEHRVRQVHDLFCQIEAFSFPTVARIHGFCLGGGLELALACRYRIALDDASTRFGFPEILLGIHPGFGGTVRLIESVGVLGAMDLMLTGRNLDARRALKLGLVDRVVPARHLDTAVRAMIKTKPAKKALSRLAALPNLPIARRAVAFELRRQVKQRAPEQHYPAPHALIRLWQTHGRERREMFNGEAQSIAQLFVSPTSKNLQRLFFLQERLKSFGRSSDLNIRHVHVIGAGTMGGDIAMWCAMKGLHVTLQDREIKYIAPAIKRAKTTFKKRIRDRYRRMRVEDNLVVDVDGSGISKADVIIEAIIEDLEAKQTVFRRIESEAKPSALIATNTSSIPLEAIAEAMEAPQRLVGVHFFNPVARMQLIEIVSSKRTDKAQVRRACEFAVQIDRQPLPVVSSPGFLINRILSPYLQEAMTLINEGISPVVIDEIAVEFGMPMGPVELADTVGLDVCLSVGEVLAAALGGEVPAVLLSKVGQGALGRKSGRGFYQYKGKRVIRPKKVAATVPVRDIRDRMILRLLNEAVACLREGVVADAELIDVGMVFGTGFAPFRGGPLHYATDRGYETIRDRLLELQRNFGDRFAPDTHWETLNNNE